MLKTLNMFKRNQFGFKPFKIKNLHHVKKLQRLYFYVLLPFYARNDRQWSPHTAHTKSDGVNAKEKLFGKILLLDIFNNIPGIVKYR